MALLNRWLKSKSDDPTLGDIATAQARLAREHADAVERHDATTREIAALTEAGADDAALDGAERRQKLAEREVARCRAARRELLAAQAKLQAAEKAELRRRLRHELVQTGDQHVIAARHAALTGARYIAARYALERHGFAIDAGLTPFLPPTVVDLSGNRTPDPQLDSHPELDRFEHSLGKVRVVFAREVAP